MVSLFKIQLPFYCREKTFLQLPCDLPDFSSRATSRSLIQCHISRKILERYSCFLVNPKEPKKEGRVVTSQNLDLGTDCGDSCIEVYRKYVEKHTKNWHIVHSLNLCRKSSSLAEISQAVPVCWRYDQPCQSFGKVIRCFCFCVTFLH